MANIALLIDIENFVSSASTLGLPLDLAPLLARLKELGSIRVRRSFGDLRRVCERTHRAGELDSLRMMLHRNLVEIEDIPFLTQHKNAADVRLVVEGLSLSFSNPTITHFAILSNDRDFVPLFNKLREMGKTLIAIVVDESNANPMLREAVDHLIYFEALFDKTTRADGFDTEADASARQEQYFKLLRQAVTILENRGLKPAGSGVAMMMRQLRSDFDPALVGCDSFRGFIQLAENAGLVSVEWPSAGGEYLLNLPAAANQPAAGIQPAAAVLPAVSAPAARATPAATSSGAAISGAADKIAPESQGASPASGEPPAPPNAAALADAYREIIELTLGIKLPRRAQRQQVFDVLADSYRELIRTDSFHLREWTTEAEYLLTSRTDSQTTIRSIYKIALTLFYARCFHVIVEDKFNPKIVGIAVPAEEWEERFSRHLAVMVLRKSHGAPLDAAAMALLLFEESEGEPLERTQALLEDVAAAAR